MSDLDRMRERVIVHPSFPNDAGRRLLEAVARLLDNPKEWAMAFGEYDDSHWLRIIEERTTDARALLIEVLR